MPPQPVPVPMFLPCCVEFVFEILPLCLKYYRKDSETIVNTLKNIIDHTIVSRCGQYLPESMSSHHVSVTGEECEEYWEEWDRVSLSW